MNILVTICARAGSKGVKNKNIRELAGKPLVAYAIEQAQEWGKAAHIVVSTDSQQISKLAQDCGAEVPFLREKQLASDESGKIAAIIDAWKRSEAHFGCSYDYVIDLDVTAPLRAMSDIDACLDLAVKKKALNVITVVPAHRNPYFNMVQDVGDGRARLVNGDQQEYLRRQDAPQIFDMNASIYVFGRGFLEQELNLFTEKTFCHVMGGISRYDIDCELDFEMVEMIVKNGLWSFQ
ncbi:MAG: acylneuraminate cytidylyltransferase family protein [Candidatus Omnitrophica bacterium]|nr:acylneuraminate cytidylyltransferase family protein [Candidatus Omnitrophota bacterium]